jgi:hypothetical protein
MCWNREVDLTGTHIAGTLNPTTITATVLPALSPMYSNVDFSTTDEPLLYDYSCSSSELLLPTGLWFPINIHMDNTNVIFHLTFKIVNPNASASNINFLLEDNNPVLGVYGTTQINTSTITVPKYSIYDYTFQFKVSATATVVSYKEMGGGAFISTIAGKTYFTNGSTTNPPESSYPTASALPPNMKAILDFALGTVDVVGIVLKSGILDLIYLRNDWDCQNNPSYLHKSDRKDSCCKSMSRW